MERALLVLAIVGVVICTAVSVVALAISLRAFEKSSEATEVSEDVAAMVIKHRLSTGSERMVF